MSSSLIAAFLWLIVANLLAMLPSRDNHWRRAYGGPNRGCTIHAQMMHNPCAWVVGWFVAGQGGGDG